MTEQEWFGPIYETKGAAWCGALMQFMVRALADNVPTNGKVDAVYLFAATQDNEREVLRRGDNLQQGGVAYFICVPDQHGYGFPKTADLWIRSLTAAGVPSARIIPISAAPGTTAPNTQTEAVELYRVCVARGWRRIGVVAPALHQTRAFLTVISEIVRRGRQDDIKVYSFPACAADWNEVAVHSSGAAQGTRAELLTGELERIAKYTNLISPEEAFAYLARRG